ncbi:phospholipase D-like domain-containing protein [Aminobacter sp. MDW-2]|uniref:phospholipase D-like domain-containing protein n=1 Tax=Aminobacter sp. MDW-2 TaxID=2666139 RepID=UPI0012AFDFCD|nr:phospholipase D-like domain-containing protein [Aminobacter sp. MDW-2]MRX35341.1 hypothetical protein [Aminobacter sp. MDW-2]QNH35633.1 hypothetical protein H5P29_06995 [Aminobacter sp. MDW-2]
MKNSADPESPAIHIVYPLLRGVRKFKIEKGRRWSVVEHLMLRAICGTGFTTDDLSRKSNLPRRVIVEALTRLMRAGWVELRVSGKQMLFVATPLGQKNAKLEALPAVLVPDARWISYYLDDLTGCVFRWREVTIKTRKDLPASNAGQYVHEIQRKGVLENLSEIYRTLEGGDELIVGSYPSASGLVPTFGLVTFRNGIPEGMPKSASTEFLDTIAEAYADAEKEIARRGKRVPAPVISGLADPSAGSRSRTGVFDSADLILDNREHLEIFETMLARAQDRVIIHSTFVSENARQRVQAILAAASNRVRIDIFFGQSDDPSGADSTSQAALKEFAGWIAESPFKDYVRLHHSTTGSHAKFIIANDRKLGWVAVVGSCNWLATKFDSFEASVRLRDKPLVAELVNALSMMSVGRKGIWNDVAQELAVLSRKIQSVGESSGRKVPLRLLFTGDHAQIPIEARNNFTRRAFVTSHRMGVAGKALTLYPLMAASTEDKVGGMELAAYYGRTTGILTGRDAAMIAREYAAAGLTLRAVERPRLHAKVLGWDSNSLAVTSLNWLSVDPSEKKFREIGVFVESTRVADMFFDRLESSQWGF